MKKLLAGTLIAASVLCIGGTGVLAAPGRGQNFTDSDGNGICDHLETSLTDGIRIDMIWTKFLPTFPLS